MLEDTIGAKGTMKAIGGYFELADRDCEEGRYPVEGVRLNTCRNALEYILAQLPDARCIHLPYYTCRAVVEPLEKLRLQYHFYHIDCRFRIAEDIELGAGNYLIANNYFGLQDEYMTELARKYGERLIVDNAQALFAPVMPGIKAAFSCRKYLGVADGAFAAGVSSAPAMYLKTDDSSARNSHLLIRKEHGAEAGFKDYQANECKLDKQPVRRMSETTQEILLHIDYEKIIAARRRNFRHLHSVLGTRNKLQIPTDDSFACPMVYPYMTDDAGLRERLIENRIYVARYWPNVLEWTETGSLENEFARNILPLPIDQRYGEEDMERIMKITGI